MDALLTISQRGADDRAVGELLAALRRLGWNVTDVHVIPSAARSRTDDDVQHQTNPALAARYAPRVVVGKR